MERLRPVLTLRGRLALLYAATLTVSLVVVFAALNAIVANVLIENTASRLELGAGPHRHHTSSNVPWRARLARVTGPGIGFSLRLLTRH